MEHTEDSVKPTLETAADFDKDSLSHLKSSKTWDEINVPQILGDRLIQLGFKNPSRIQELVIPASFYSSVYAQSQNGSGKTLSFLIPSILTVDSSQSHVEGGVLTPQVLILADTRALIIQLDKLAEKISTCYPGLKTGFSFSGVEEEGSSGHIFITTVTRINGLTSKSKIDFKKLRLLVLDEADQVMASDLQNKFIPKFLFKILPPQVKMILTSATMTPATQQLVEKTDKIKNFIKFEVQKENLTLTNVQQFFIQSDKNSMMGVLDIILDKLSVNNILIFTNNRKEMHEIQQHLLFNQHKSTTVASNELSDRSQEANINHNAIDKFMQGQFRVLITTNLLSRGIDMRKVSLVVNVGVPLEYPKIVAEGEKSLPKGPDFETYLHRVGRTGRYGDKGIALNIITDSRQKDMLDQIINYYQIKMTELGMDEVCSLDDYLKEITEYNKEKREILEENI